ncbi:acyl carrier protein [Streptomyces gilvosporeus]|uniref:Carrier domain-containing protein n=1 Tax=Streptomyces gilvosporeus TaxID=553510 RepID=A0A1V0TLM4_9ACTN|nr:acyl carrier protein [Streptomyces gilvosporeus]ARF53831.1 hypothetical protein B1H19_06250 [Streptomyces gilvosporeus]
MDADDAVYRTARKLMSERFGVPVEDIRPDTTFDELDMDSLALAEFTFDLRDEFSVLLTTQDVNKRSTLTDVARILTKRLASRPPGTP